MYSDSSSILEFIETEATSDRTNEFTTIEKIKCPVSGIPNIANMTVPTTDKPNILKKKSVNLIFLMNICPSENENIVVSSFIIN